MVSAAVERYGGLHILVNNVGIHGPGDAMTVDEEEWDRVLTVNPNPPKDTDGRREDSGRGWVRELQGRWPGVLG